MPKKKTLVIVSLLVLIMMLVYWRWFFTNGVFTWGDWGWYFRDTVLSWLYPPQILYYSPFGAVDISIAQYLPIRLLYSLLARVGDFNLFDRFVFIFPSVIVPVISSFYLSKKLFRNNASALVASLVYSLNSYTLTLETGHFTLGVAFAFAPVILALFMDSLETFNLKKSLFTGLLAFLTFSYEPRGFYLIAVIMTFYLAYYLLFIKNIRNVKQIINTIFIFAIPFLVLTFACLYGIVGLYLASGALSQKVLNRPLYGNEFVSIQRGFALSIQSWAENIPSYSWLIPVFSYLGLWLGRKDKKVLFFGFITLLGILLVKQSNQPFTGLYLWLYRYFPGFNAFREPSKFYFLIALGYSVLLGNLAKSIKKNIFVFIILLPFLLNIIPVIQGKYGNLNTPRNLPEDYIIYKNFLDKNYGLYRTLFVPRASRWGYWDPNIRKEEAVSYTQYPWQELSGYTKKGLEYNFVDDVMSILEKKNSDNILNLLSIKYVVIPMEDKANGEDLIFSQGNRTDFINRISQLKYLTPLNIGTSELQIYENPDYRPILYWTKEPENLNTTQNIGKIEVTDISPTEYSLIIKDIPQGQNQIVINFSQRFDSRWELKSGPFSWMDTIINKNYYLNSEHGMTDVQTNYFIIDLKQFNGKTSDLNLHLYYASQAYLNIATIISIVSIFIVLFILFK